MAAGHQHSAAHGRVDRLGARGECAMTANFYAYLDAYCRNLVASGVSLTEVDGHVIVSHPNPGRALFKEDPAPLEALQLRVDMKAAAILKLMHEGREYV